MMKTRIAAARRKALTRTLLLAATFGCGSLLTGCAQQQPGQSETYRPYAKVVANKVCITLPRLHSGEKLFSLYISERGSESGYLMRQYPWQKGKYLAATPGKCVPDFSFPYVIGRGYDVAIQVIDPAVITQSNATQGRVYSGAFTLWRAGNKLHVAPIM